MLVRCPQCSDLLANSRLAVDEREHRVNDIIQRQDDADDEAQVLRFLGKEMLRDPYGFLSIYGQKGSGKSLLLTALVAEFCKRGRSAVYFNADDIVRMLHPGDYSDGELHVPGDPEARYAYLQRVEVLAVDEIDKLPWTNWQVQRIGALIEYRHRQAERLVTLFSMNKAPWAWNNVDDVQHIGDRLADGRFNRLWPLMQVGNMPPREADGMPPCMQAFVDIIDGQERHYAPGLFETKLPSIRRQLRRYAPVKTMVQPERTPAINNAPITRNNGHTNGHAAKAVAG